MTKYINKEKFLRSMGLEGDETKYCNKDGEHQRRSYSTYLAYEILDSVEDSEEEDVAPVVHSEWINRSGGNATCKRCGVRQFAVNNVDGEQNFCGHCGAMMDGGNHEKVET